MHCNDYIENKTKRRINKNYYKLLNKLNIISNYFKLYYKLNIISNSQMQNYSEILAQLLKASLKYEF